MRHLLTTMRRPMSVLASDMTVQVAVDRHDFHPADSLTATVVVGGAPDERVQGGRVELVYVNRYLEHHRDSDGDTETVTRQEDVVVVWIPLPAAADGPVAFGTHQVTLDFPPDAPPTAHEPGGFGDIVRWEVRGILDRRMAFDPDAAVPVTVYSRPEQYGWQAQSPPVPKSTEVPMGLDMSTRFLRPGEGMTGTLTIAPRESVKGRSIRVQAERRRIDTPDNITRTESLPGVELAGATDLEAGQTYQFPFDLWLPQGVPPTFNAAKNHQHWYVEGIVDRKMRSDFVVEAEIVVFTGNPMTAPGAQPAAVQQPAQPVAAAQPAPAAPSPAQPAPAAASAQPAPAAGAGWHPDPWLHARLRYWDGNEWTGHTAD
jgi:uncharacterized protein DUF2510